MIIKYHLSKIRKIKKLSLIQLSAKSNVSKSCISEIEREKKKPLFETICKLAAALDVPLSEMYSCEEEFADKDQYNKTGDFRNEQKTRTPKA